MDESKKIESVRHTPERDQKSIHNAVNKASRDANFISQAVQQLDALQFPAYKYQILNFVKSKSTDENAIAMFNPLNHTVLFRNKYALK
jgi:hypothetical protein